MSFVLNFNKGVGEDGGVHCQKQDWESRRVLCRDFLPGVWYVYADPRGL